MAKKRGTYSLAQVVEIFKEHDGDYRRVAEVTGLKRGTVHSYMSLARRKGMLGEPSGPEEADKPEESKPEESAPEAPDDDFVDYPTLYLVGLFDAGGMLHVTESSIYAAYVINGPTMTVWARSYDAKIIGSEAVRRARLLPGDPGFAKLMGHLSASPSIHAQKASAMGGYVEALEMVEQFKKELFK